jgi:hypothetical protein
VQLRLQNPVLLSEVVVGIERISAARYFVGIRDAVASLSAGRDSMVRLRLTSWYSLTFTTTKTVIHRIERWPTLLRAAHAMINVLLHVPAAS